jgi:hypothetical protein
MEAAGQASKFGTVAGVQERWKRMNEVARDCQSDRYEEYREDWSLQKSQSLKTKRNRAQEM